MQQLCHELLVQVVQLWACHLGPSTDLPEARGHAHVSVDILMHEDHTVVVLRSFQHACECHCMHMHRLFSWFVPCLCVVLPHLASPAWGMPVVGLARQAVNACDS